jgi:hypothetical protein
MTAEEIRKRFKEHVSKNNIKITRPQDILDAAEEQHFNKKEEKRQNTIEKKAKEIRKKVKELAVKKSTPKRKELTLAERKRLEKEAELTDSDDDEEISPREREYINKQNKLINDTQKGKLTEKEYQTKKHALEVTYGKFKFDLPKQPKLSTKNVMKSRSDIKTIDGQKHILTDMVVDKTLSPAERKSLKKSIYNAIEMHLKGAGLIVDIDGQYNNHPYTDHLHDGKIYFSSDSESDNERPTVKTIAKRRGRPPNIQEPISRITGGDLGYDIASFVTHNILGMQKSKGKGTGRGRGRPRKIIC